MKLMKANDLPKNWQLKTLAQVCTSTGSNITLKNIQDKKGDYPIYGASGVVSYVDFYTKENQSLGIVKDGAGIGRVFLLPPKASVIGTLHYVESNDDLNLKFLFYFLQSINLARYITGSAIPHIYFRDWKKEQIPIPPLEIQKHIVKRLDEAFSRIESGTKHLQSAKDNLVKYKQSLLKSAFNGTLTQDCPLLQGESTTPSLRGSNATEAIHTKEIDCHESLRDSRNDENSPSLAEGARGWVNTLNDNALDCHESLRDSRNDDKDLLNGKSANLPQSWVIKTLGEIFLIERGGSPRPIKQFLTNDKNGINWIKIGDTKNVSKYIYSTAEKIKPEGKKHSRFVEVGDLILSNSMSFGRPYIMKTTGCIHDGWVVFRNTKKLIDEEYAYYVLTSSQIYAEFSKLATGSTVKNLSIDRVKQVAIPIPPLETQKQIVAVLEKHFTSADKVSAYIESCLTKAKQLKSSLLKSAFEGKL